MDVMSRRVSSSSSLNPNAPLFVPLAYKTVEEFSDEWWQLVDSSAWFRDYWVQESFHHNHHQEQKQKQQKNKKIGQEDEHVHDYDAVLLPDADVLFHGYQPQEEEKEYYRREVAVSRTETWSRNCGPAEEEWRWVEWPEKVGNTRMIWRQW